MLLLLFVFQLSFFIEIALLSALLLGESKRRVCCYE